MATLAGLAVSVLLGLTFLAGCESTEESSDHDHRDHGGWDGGNHGGWGGDHGGHGGWGGDRDAVDVVSGWIRLEGYGVPPGAWAVVRIVDLNDFNRILNEQDLGEVTSTAMPFELFYDGRQVDPRHVYNLEAEVRDRTGVIMAPRGPVHVITHENQVEDITLVLAYVGGATAPVETRPPHGTQPQYPAARPQGPTRASDNNEGRKRWERTPRSSGTPSGSTSPAPSTGASSGGAVIMPRAVSGTVSSRRHMQLGAGSTLVVELLDASGSAVAARSYGAASLPQSFELPLDGSRMRPDGGYTVRARVENQGRTILTSSPVSVLTRGAAATGVQVLF